MVELVSYLIDESLRVYKLCNFYNLEYVEVYDLNQWEEALVQSPSRSTLLYSFLMKDEPYKHPPLPSKQQIFKVCV